jgi:Ca2+-binding RTX toxin-like protein
VNAGTITGGTGVTLSPTADAQSAVVNNGIIQAFGRIALGPNDIASGVMVDNFSAVAGTFATALIVNTGTISGAGTTNQSEPIAIACRDVLSVGGTVAIIVENSGLLAGGVLGEDGADAVRNSGRITHTVSLRENGDSLRNSGIIEGAVFMGNSTDYVRNLGRMENNVSLGADNDTYDGRGGTLLEGVYGDDGNDELTGGSMEDTLSGGTGNDTLSGGSGDDELAGDQGNDVINGRNDNDTISGGAGADTMSGGAGADRFVFELAANIGKSAATRDRIVDFTSGLDTLDLSDVDANTNEGGNNSFVFIGGNAFSNVAGQLRYVAASGLLSGDTNGDGQADFNLELVNRPSLQALDLIL